MPSEIEEIQQKIDKQFREAENANKFNLRLAVPIEDQNDETDGKCFKLRKNHRPTNEFSRFMCLSEVIIFKFFFVLIFL